MLSDRRWLSNDLLWRQRSEIQSKLWGRERSYYLCTSIRAECVVGLSRVRMVERVGSSSAEVARSGYSRRWPQKPQAWAGRSAIGSLVFAGAICSHGRHSRLDLKSRTMCDYENHVVASESLQYGNQ